MTLNLTLTPVDTSHFPAFSSSGSLFIHTTLHPHKKRTSLDILLSTQVEINSRTPGSGQFSIK